MERKTQPFIQKLIDADIIEYGEIYHEDSQVNIVYFIKDNYCCVYSSDSEEELDMMVADISEWYDENGNFINFQILPISEYDEIYDLNIEGKLQVYKRITI